MIRPMIKLCSLLGIKRISQQKKVSMSMPEEEPQSSVQLQRAPKPEFLTETRFDEFNLHDEVLAGLNDAGFTYCTPIQAQTLPVSLTASCPAGSGFN